RSGSAPVQPRNSSGGMVNTARLFVSDRQALRCDNAVGCKDSQLITPPAFLVAPCNAMTELALRSTNQHRPRRWLLSGGSQPRRSQLTDGRTLWRKLVLSSGES